jgi:hypothetical protein
MGGFQKVLDDVRAEREVSDRRRPRVAAYARVREFAHKLNLLLHEPTVWAWAKGSSPEWDGTVPEPATDRETALGHRLYELAAEVFAPVRNRDLSRVTSTRIAKRLLAPTGRIQGAVAAVWMAGELGVLDVDTTDLKALQAEAVIVFKRQLRTSEVPVAGADVLPGNPGRIRPPTRHRPGAAISPVPASPEEMARVAEWWERNQDSGDPDQMLDEETAGARQAEPDGGNNDRIDGVAGDGADTASDSQGGAAHEGIDPKPTALPELEGT